MKTIDIIQYVIIPSAILALVLGLIIPAIIRWVASGDEVSAPDATPEEIADDQIRAAKVYPFSNPITLAILLIVIGLIVLGVFLIIKGQLNDNLTISLVGLGVGALGIAAWWAGDKEHEDDPIMAGAITFWDTHVRIGGKSVVVGGRTVLADYFPFNLGTVEFDISNKNLVFKFTVVSQDNVHLTGQVSITGFADPDDAYDYIRAGKSELKIKEQIDDIVYEETKILAEGFDAVLIAKRSDCISKPLRKKLERYFQVKAFGWKIIRVNAVFMMPQEIVNAMNGLVKEGYDRANENFEYKTDLDAAKKLYEEIRDSRTEESKTITMQACIGIIKDLRLIRDERYAKIDSNGAMVLADAKLNMGKSTSDKPSNPKGKS